MASSLNASTSGGGGIITTADASGNLNIQSGGSTVVAVTSAGATVTGTLAATGGITATGLTSKIQPITASVAASALTITLNPTILDFRASPLTSGTVTTIAVPAAISVTIPSTSTMGTVSAVQSRIVVIAINNAGTVELAAVNISGGSVLDETTLITTTAAAAAGNSATAYYSTTARTGVAYRVVGYVESTQATAGTWVTAPSTLQGYGGQALAAMSSLGYGQVYVRRDSAGGNSTRAFAVNYYNTSGKPKYVFVGGSPNAIGAGISATVGSGMAGQIYTNASTNYQSSVGLSFVVPVGQSYEVSVTSGGVTCDTWCELG
jgi:hypothetical protein